MPSRTSSWPSGWPSFTPKDNDLSNTFQKVLKASVIAEYGAEALHVSWTKTCNALNSVTSRISTLGNTSIPVLSYDEALSATNYEFRERMKATGCFIIRGVISKAETVQHFGDLKTFIADNEDIITGWPAKSVAIYHLYSSPTQLKIRTNPRHLKVQRFLNSLWTDSSCSLAGEVAQSEPICTPMLCASDSQAKNSWAWDHTSMEDPWLVGRTWSIARRTTRFSLAFPKSMTRTIWRIGRTQILRYSRQVLRVVFYVLFKVGRH